MNWQQPELNKGNILIVDDTPDNLRLLSTALTAQGYKVRNAINGAMALIGAKAIPPDLILLDIKMPDMDGYEVCQALKKLPDVQNVPIIFLSSIDEVFDKIRAFEVGAVDYISKPFHIDEVIARIKNQLTIRYLQDSLEQQNACLESEVRHRIAAELKVRQLNAELEERVKQRTQQLELANQQLLHMALHDELTGLPNRALFMECLEKALDRSKQDEDYSLAVLFLDCDRFKLINDSFGHVVGDHLLVAVAQRLKACLRPLDTLARLGGDEFTILLEGIKSPNEATQVAQQIQQELTLPFFLDPYEVFIDASIGIVLKAQEYEKAEHLLRDADTAMYQAKRSGKSRYQIFEPVMYRNTLVRLQLETDLRRALQREEFFVYYQPIVSLVTGEITGFEALLRWHHPTLGLVSPQMFIPVAEETELIVPLGLWVFQQACQQLQTWQQRFKNNGSPPLTMSINLSVKQFLQPNLVEQIDEILSQTQLNSQSLKLEITESVLIDQSELATQVFQKLRERNILLSLDDFGTGYSSLSYLHRFPVDTLKIDRFFVSQIKKAEESKGIIQAIITLAHQLGMSVIAEGVETAQQVQQLKSLGCEEAQGFFFSKPLTPECAIALITEKVTYSY